MSLTKETKATVIAHIAGIIDAKGCFGIYPRTDRSGNINHYATLKVCSTNPKIPRFLMKNIGYGHLHSYYSDIHGKDVWTWELFPADQKTFISTIFPFLKIKFEQALKIVEFHEITESDLSLETKKRKKARLAQQCKDLKRSTVFPMILRGNGMFPNVNS